MKIATENSNKSAPKLLSALLALFAQDVWIRGRLGLGLFGGRWFYFFDFWCYHCLYYRLKYNFKKITFFLIF